jgi:hypothetical protein
MEKFEYQTRKYMYKYECVTLEKLFTAPDQIMPMEPAHIVSEEEEEECEEETDGTVITMETTLGLDDSVSLRVLPPGYGTI